MNNLTVVAGQAGESGVDAGVFQVAPFITTPLMLLALGVLAVYSLMVFKVRAESERLRDLPDGDRLALADKLAAKYGVPVHDLPPRDRTRIVLQELNRRAEERRRVGWFSFAAFVLTAILWYGSIIPPRANEPVAESVEEQPLNFVSYLRLHPSERSGGPERTRFELDTSFPGGPWTDSVLSMTRLEYGHVRGDVEAFLVHIEIKNTSRRATVLDLHEGYFALEDNRGVASTLASFCCRQSARAPLRSGEARTVQLIFTGTGWHGKDLDVHTLYFRIRGLKPVVEAEWRFWPLVTMAGSLTR